jgi:hypothetical protein
MGWVRFMAWSSGGSMTGGEINPGPTFGDKGPVGFRQHGSRAGRKASRHAVLPARGDAASFRVARHLSPAYAGAGTLR